MNVKLNLAICWALLDLCECLAICWALAVFEHSNSKIYSEAAYCKRAADTKKVHSKTFLCIKP